MPGRRAASKLSAFGSLRFDGIVPLEAAKVGAGMAERGASLEIINMVGGGDIDAAVIDGIEHCDTFIVFGSMKYGEDTGNAACTYYESKYAQDQKKRIILIRMIPFGEQFEHPQARFMFGLNKLVIPWVLGTPMPHDLVDKILEAMEIGGGAQPEPEPQPAPLSPAPASPAPGASAGAWPAELAVLTGIPGFVECLAGLEIHSLEEFGDNLDTDEGHDKQLCAVLDALPTKPRKNKLLRNRAQIALADLLHRHALFIEFDADEDGFLSRVECMRIPIEKLQAKAGGTLGDNFDGMDVDGDGKISFAEMFLHAEISEGEAVPPPDAAGAWAAEPAPEQEVAKDALAAERAQLAEQAEELRRQQSAVEKQATALRAEQEAASAVLAAGTTLAGGYSIGDKVVSTIEHSSGSSSISPGSEGVVLGPSTNPSAADSDERVHVQFDGMQLNMAVVTQIKAV